MLNVNPALHVRPLTAADAETYRNVRLAVLRSDPTAFVTTAAEFEARALDSIAKQIDLKDSAVTLGAFLQGELVGILSLVRETGGSVQHRADIYGVGVLKRARGQGAGDALMHAAIAQAQAWPGVTRLNLAVTETQHAARKLYERHGFTVWGTEPDAVQHHGQLLSEHWMNRPV